MQALSSQSVASANTAGLCLTVLCGVSLLFLPRRLAMVPLLLLVCYMTMGNGIVVAGMNFPMIRVLLIFGWLRLISRGELSKFSWTAADTIVIAWAVMRTLDYTLVRGTSAAFINRLGYAYNIVGCYFLFRFLVRTRKDILQALRYLSILIVPLALLMVVEKVAGRNVFSVFGGVPLIPEMRDGVLRCQGPFGHPILAGTFGATSLTMIAGMWDQQVQTKRLTVLAIVSSLVITLTAGSSGPVLACVTGVAALFLWRVRHRMRVIRWSIVGVLLALQIVMNSPVWFVMARLTVFSGSTGWFRGFVIDQTVKHFSEWWLIGSSAAMKWDPFLMDITNQYVAEALDGGLISLVLFVAIFWASFRMIGRLLRSRGTTLKVKHFAWALGSTIFAHMVNFISITYFDQNFVMLYFLLAAIPVFTSLPSPLPARKSAVPNPFFEGDSAMQSSAQLAV